VKKPRLKKGMLVKNKLSGTEAEIHKTSPGAKYIWIRTRLPNGRWSYRDWPVQNIELVE